MSNEFTHPWPEGTRIKAANGKGLEVSETALGRHRREFPRWPANGTLGTILSGGRQFRNDGLFYYTAAFDGHDKNSMGGRHAFQIDQDMVDLAP